MFFKRIPADSWVFYRAMQTTFSPVQSRWSAILSLGGLLAATATNGVEQPPADIRRDAVVAAVEKTMPSVVNIATTTIREYVADPTYELFRQFFGWQTPSATQRREEPYSIGSGVIIDEEGYILTNFHVLERASRVQVKLWDGRVYEAVPLVYTPKSDIAMLKINHKAGDPPFTPVRLALDDDLLLGETVIALGNPYGLGGSVARGILSSKNRRPAAGSERLSVGDWLQTDAAINPGNSGGPLINLHGELIGINVAVYREQVGMGVGFAIPVKQVAASLSGFFTPEWTDALWCGAKFRAGPYPLSVTEVQPGSPADKGGLRVGQEVVRINGKTPASLVEAAALIATSRDQLVTFAVRDEGRSRNLKVQMVQFDEVIRQKLGLTLIKLTPESAASFGISLSRGLFIEEVDAGSPAAQAELRRGMLLTEIEGQATGEINAVISVITAKKSGDPIQLTVGVPQRLNNRFAGFRPGIATLRLR